MLTPSRLSARTLTAADAGGELAPCLSPDQEDQPAGEGAAAFDDRQAATLPTLATAGDVREVVKFLKKKPAGVTVVEAMDAVKKRIFDPVKVSAYEYWGIVLREDNRLRLSPLGWECARRLEPEALAFRAILRRTPPYHSALAWIQEQGPDLVTHADVAAYWQKDHETALDLSPERGGEGNVVSFFHLCQAAELGITTVGKRGQPARLRVDRDELAAYLQAPPANPAACPNQSSNLEPEPPAPVNLAESAAAPGAWGGESDNRRVFVSCGRVSRIVEQARVALELADFESHVSERRSDESLPLADSTVQAMRRCHAGVIVVTGDDGHQDGAVAGPPGQVEDDVLSEISAAFALYNGRVVLLWDRQLAPPPNLRGLCRCEFDGDDLTWDSGVRLVKAIKNFKSNRWAKDSEARSQSPE